MSLHLRIVTPIVSTEFGGEALEDLRAALRPTTRLDMVWLEQGPRSIETELDEALAVPGTLRRVAEAADAGCDAAILNCVGDPGLAAARELVEMPVLGPGQAGMHLASMLGARFSIVVARRRGIPPMEALADRHGFQSKLASVRALEIPVLELEGNPQRLVEGLFEQSRLAIQRDGAEVIMLGSTGMTRIGRELEQRLAESDTPAPVIDPLLAATILAESLALIGLRHHRYPQPASGTALLDSLLGRSS